MKKIAYVLMGLIACIGIVGCSIKKNAGDTIVLDSDVEKNKSEYKVSIEKLELENKGFRAF